MDYGTTKLLCAAGGLNHASIVDAVAGAKLSFILVPPYRASVARVGMNANELQHSQSVPLLSPLDTVEQKMPSAPLQLTGKRLHRSCKPYARGNPARAGTLSMNTPQKRQKHGSASRQLRG